MLITKSQTQLVVAKLIARVYKSSRMVIQIFNFQVSSQTCPLFV
jgi:hypothetical protein